MIKGRCQRAVGRAAVHKTLTEYDGQQYYLGGFGGLAVWRFCRNIKGKVTRESWRKQHWKKLPKSG